MEDSVGVLCSICHSVLTTVETAFCPACGHAVFKNAVFYNKSISTSQYDPFGRYAKPWKDKPLVKVRKYANSKEKSLPWYPTMRQPRLPRREIAKVKTLVPSEKTEIDIGEEEKIFMEDESSVEMSEETASSFSKDASSTESAIHPAPERPKGGLNFNAIRFT
jgi:hypothetical protein